MALCWNLSECKTWQSTYALDDEGKEIIVDGKRQFADEEKSDQLWADIQTIGMMLINVGFPKGEWGINDENWQEVYTRIYMAEKAMGAMRKQWDHELKISHDVYFQPIDIYELIGAKVNSGCKTNLQADKAIAKILRRRAQEKINSFCKQSTI